MSNTMKILLVPLLAAIVLTLFAWPNARLAPRDLPVGVVGPAPAQLDRDAFDVRHYADVAEARDAVEQRDVYGAFVTGPGGPRVLTSSAASPAVAQLLTHAAGEAPVEDVVAAPPAGGALASSVLPLVIAGCVCGLLAGALAPTALRRTGLLVTGSVLAGLTATAIIQGWLGVVDGSWLANAGTLSLTVLAIGATMLGLRAVLGHIGIALGVITMVLVGNPFAAAGTAPELLPQPVGGLGQLLPPGAGGNLLRSTGFFDGAGAGGHIVVLAAWAAAGLALVGVAALRGRRRGVAAMPAVA